MNLSKPVIADPKAIESRRNGGKIVQRSQVVREDDKIKEWRKDHILPVRKMKDAK